MNQKLNTPVVKCSHYSAVRRGLATDSPYLPCSLFVVGQCRFGTSRTRSPCVRHFSFIHDILTILNNCFIIEYFRKLALAWRDLITPNTSDVDHFLTEVTILSPPSSDKNSHNVAVIKQLKMQCSSLSTPFKE